MKKLLVILAAIAMVGTFAATTIAADWAMYGSARMGTWYVTEDKKGDEEGDLAWGEQGNARFGARVKASDAVSGRMEFGVSGGNANQRLLYADWNFGPGRMRIGQAYAPGNIFISNKVYGDDGNNLNFGGLYTGRQEEISFKFNIVEIALIKPSTGYESALSDAVNDPNAPADPSLNIDVMIPKIEAAVVYGQENWWVQGSLGYQTYTVKDTADFGNGDVNVDVDITSMVYGVGGMFNMAGAYIGAVVMGGTNAGVYGSWHETAAAPTPKVSGNGSIDIDDTTTFGWNLVVGYNINDMLKVEAGYGWIQSDNDQYDKADAAQAFYVNLPISLAPGVTITPEFGVEDQMKSAADTDQGSDTYFGAKWQIDF